MLFCHITTHIDGEKHANLLEEKGGEGFPHIVFMDAEGKVVAVHEEERTAAAFARTGENVKAYVALKPKAEKGDKAAKVDFALVQLELGKIKLDDAQKQIKESGATLTKEQKAKLDGIAVNASIMEVVEGIQNDETKAKAAGKQFYEMQKAGKPGPTSEAAIQPYYILGLRAAEEAKDAAVFEKNLKVLKDKFGSNPRAQKFFEEQEKKLEGLKGGDKK